MIALQNTTMRSASHNASPKKKEAPIKLMDGAYIELEHMIVTGRLKPGQWVSETELIALSGYSRAPVRSAIQRLADQQLLIVERRRGAQVCPIDFTQQFRALEFRRVVEGLLVSSAAERASPAQRRQFAELAKEFRAIAKLKKQSRLTLIDARHFALTLETADNVFAAKAMTSVKGLSRRFWIINQGEHGDFSRMALAHADVAQAISAGSAQQAVAAVDALIDYVQEFTLKVIGYTQGK